MKILIGYDNILNEDGTHKYDLEDLKELVFEYYNRDYFSDEALEEYLSLDYTKTSSDFIEDLDNVIIENTLHPFQNLSDEELTEYLVDSARKSGFNLPLVKRTYTSVIAISTDYIEED